MSLNIRLKIKAKDKKFHGDLANSLIKAAINYVEKNKSLDFGIRDLTKKLGVSHAAAYRHFENKHALLEEISARGYLALKEQIAAAMVTDTDPTQAMGRAYVEFGIQNPGYYRVMYGTTFKSLKEAYLDPFFGLMDMIGERNAENAKKIFFAWASAHGFIMLIIDGQETIPKEDFNLTEEDLKNFLLGTINNVIKSENIVKPIKRKIF